MMVEKHTVEEWARQPVRWEETGDPEMPFRAMVGASSWVVSLNDFPAEPMYSLLIDGETVGDFDEWPTAWEKVESDGQE